MSDEPTILDHPIDEPPSTVLVDEAPTYPTSDVPTEGPTDPVGGPPPWPGAAPGPSGPGMQPPSMGGTPPAPPAAPHRTGGWRPFVAGALVGALVGGATAGGVYLATKDDTSSRTVIVRSAAGTVRNTSVIAQPKDIQGLLGKVEPAVVAVRTGAAVDAGLFSGSSGQSGGAGTGFVISSDGVIVTNNHVIEGADGRIEVSFADGTSKTAKVLGHSAENDLAVLKIDASNLPVAKLGSSDSMQVGDEVVAIGNALALDGGLSVTRGIISAKGRTVPESETGAVLYDMLQTDAAINPGNSGGPLVNSNGEVVGINTALAGGSQNVGFAISIDSAKAAIGDLRQGDQVATAFLGVEMQQVNPAVAKQLHLVTSTGAVVRKVTAGSAAEKAGLKENDVVVAIDGAEVQRPDDVGAKIRRHKPGDDVQVTIERAGKQQDVTVTLGTRPKQNG